MGTDSTVRNRDILLKAIGFGYQFVLSIEDIYYDAGFNLVNLDQAVLNLADP